MCLTGDDRFIQIGSPDGFKKTGMTVFIKHGSSIGKLCHEQGFRCFFFYFGKQCPGAFPETQYARIADFARNASDPEQDVKKGALYVGKSKIPRLYKLCKTGKVRIRTAMMQDPPGKRIIHIEIPDKG